MAVERVPGLKTTVWYDGQDISVRIDPYLLELVYVDHLEGTEPDALEVKLEDRQRIFQGPLYARRGAALRFSFGLDQGPTFESAKGFLIDEIQPEGPPDTVRWRAIGQLPSAALHTRTCKLWSGTTLEDVAQSIGKAHGMKVVVQGEGVKLKALYQVDESDLAFLRRMAKDYGMVVSLKGGTGDEGKPTVVLTGLDHLMTQAPVYEIRRSHNVRFRFRDKTTPGARGAYTRYFDSDLKELVEFEEKVAEVQGRDRVTREAVPGLPGKGHQLRTRHRQAPEVHVRRALKSPQGYEHEATLTLPGNPKLRSGVMVSLPADGEDGWQVQGGLWLAIHSRQVLQTSDGYETELTLRRKK